MFEKYSELIGTILTPEDRKKFEKAVGSALKGGSKTALVITGDTGTGKSSLLKIAQTVLTQTNGVVFSHDRVSKTLIKNSKYLFAATNIPVDFSTSTNIVVINTTGRVLPRQKYFAIMDPIKINQEN